MRRYITHLNTPIDWEAIPLDRSRDGDALHRADCLRWQADLKRGQPLHDPYPRPSYPSAQAWSDQAGRRGRKLPPDGELLRLSRAMSADQIAQRYGVQPQTVTSMVARARRR